MSTSDRDPGIIIKDGALISTEVMREFFSDLVPAKALDRPRDVIRYVPQPRQAELLKAAGLYDWLENTGARGAAITDIIGYGGAAYGGKTYALLGLALVAAYAYPGVQIGYFRRTYSELEGAGSAIHDAYEVYAGVAVARDSGRVWKFGDTGSALYFQHCENESDVFSYQSKQYDILIIDEATHFTWFQVDYLKTRNRVSGDNGIPLPFMVVASNPGNIGHAWYMQMFGLDHIENWLTGKWSKPQEFSNPNNKKVLAYFIPSFIQDNIIGMERDPGYEKRLWESNPDTAEALIKGDWKVFSGMAFRQFDPDVHVIPFKDLPRDWLKFPKWRAVDWGYNDPFCCLWAAKDPDNGRVYVYREVYEAGLTDAQQALSIIMNTPVEEGITITYGDPVSFNTRHNKNNLVYTSADEYRENGVFIWNADNNRLNGKKKIDQMLAPLNDGKPGLMITDNCVNLIRTLPKLARSQVNPEDVAQKQEDHPYDTLRYLVTNVGVHSAKKQGEGEKTKYNPWVKIPGL